MEGHEEIQTATYAQQAREGKVLLLMFMIVGRLGVLSTESQTRLQELSTTQLNDLGLALFDFNTLADVEAWLLQPN